MAISLSRNERLYVQDQTDLLTIPNSSGTSTLAVANYCPHIRFKATPIQGLLRRRDKTGVRTAQPGVGGRRMANWEAEFSLASSGLANQPPLFGPVLRSLMGAAHTAVTGSGSITGATNATPIVITQTAHGKNTGDACRVSGVTGNTAANGPWVIKKLTNDTYELIGSSGNGAYVSGGTASFAGIEYKLTDNILSFVAALFRTPSTLQQRIAYGTLARQATFNLGADVAEFTAGGEMPALIDSDTFSTEPLEIQAALTAFPTEPAGTLPADAGMIAGFTGRCVVDGKTFSGVRTATINVTTGNDLVKENFGRFTPDEVEGDERVVTSSIVLNDKDDAAMKALYAAWKAKTPIDQIFQVGTVALNTFFFQLRGVQLDSTDLDDGQRRFVRSYSNCLASGSAPGALDEFRINII